MTFTPGKAVLRTCIDMARRGFSEEDFKRFALMSFRFGEQYLDLVMTLNFLKEIQVVGTSAGNLQLLDVENSDWFAGEISSGSTLVWDVLDNIPFPFRKFNPDQTAQALLGAQGELAVMRDLHEKVLPDLRDKIRQVSLVSDHFGYDIEAPSRFEERGLMALEVKTSSRPGDYFKFFLSRNEYRVGLETEYWSLVFVQMVGSKFEVLGHLPHSEIKSRVPKNIDNGFVWESASGAVHKNEIFPGLPE